MQAQLTKLTNKIKAEEHKESGLSNRINSLSSQVHKVQRDENQLQRKEAVLEKKEKTLENKATENGQGDLEGLHEIHMTPLMPHMQMPDIFGQMGN